MKVYFYWPNLIGYIRILFLYIFYLYFDSKRYLSLIIYFLSFALDGVDGHVARYFNQATIFGEVLDMLTDRMGTMILCIINLQSSFSYCKSFIVFWLILDLSSHWMQTLFAYKTNCYHKNIKSYFKLLSIYYTNKPFMLTLACGSEFFLLFNSNLDKI